MKKLAFLFLAGGITLTACNNGPAYKIAGTVEGISDGETVYLQELQGRNLINLDSAIVKNGAFTFKGQQDSAVNRYITYATEDARIMTDFFLENGDINVLLAEDSRATGTPNNDINVHYGNWNVIVLPGWNTANDSIMVMSSEANKHLSGNMLFNRVPLTVSNWIDYHTGNYIWNGRCRFGVGFGSYKHILLATDTELTLQNGSKM